METIPFAEQVDRAIKKAGVTILGVSIGKQEDKSTWRVDHLATATKADRDLAAATIAKFSADDPQWVIDAMNERIDATLDAPLVQAMLKVFSPLVGKTPAECRDNLKTELQKAGQ